MSPPARPRLAVAVGGARGWQDELAELLEITEPDVYIACNDAGTEIEPLDHWCSLHPEKLVRENRDHPKHWSWVRQRIEAGRSRDFVTWSHESSAGIDRVITGWSDGASGLLCTGLALEMAELVVLVGIRMDRHPNAYRDEKRWNIASNYHHGWKRVHDRIETRVRSMAGWTQRRFGAPTAEWLDAPRGVRVASV